jgi:hypothetical protein
LRLVKTGIHVLGEWDLSTRALQIRGDLRVDGSLTLGNATATSASAGTAHALPSIPEGYVIMIVGGVARKIPYYN